MHTTYLQHRCSPYAHTHTCTPCTQAYVHAICTHHMQAICTHHTYTTHACTPGAHKYHMQIMHRHMHVQTHVCTHTCTYTHMHVHTCAHAHMHVYTRMHTLACTQVNITPGILYVKYIGHSKKLLGKSGQTLL